MILLQVRSEHLLYDMVARWFTQDDPSSTDPAGRGKVPLEGAVGGRTEEGLDGVLKHVRFCLMSAPQLLQLQQHWFTQQHRGALTYISEGLKYHQDVRTGNILVSYQK